MLCVFDVALPIHEKSAYERSLMTASDDDKVIHGNCGCNRARGLTGTSPELFPCFQIIRSCAGLSVKDDLFRTVVITHTQMMWEDAG